MLAIQLIEVVYIVFTGFNDTREARGTSQSLKSKLLIEVISFLNDPLKDCGFCKKLFK